MLLFLWTLVFNTTLKCSHLLKNSHHFNYSVIAFIYIIYQISNFIWCFSLSATFFLHSFSKFLNSSSISYNDFYRASYGLIEPLVCTLISIVCYKGWIYLYPEKVTSFYFSRFILIKFPIRIIEKQINTKSMIF